MTTMTLKLRVAAILLACTALFAAWGGVFAYDANKAQTQAEALKTLGLFQGTDQGFELDRAPSRMDVLIMLLRMTGQEGDARFYEGKSPFIDAPTWDSAAAYLAYAFDKGLTTGVTADRFDPTAPATAQTYLTFMLRALGYTEASVWEQWESLSKAAGLLPAGVSTKDFKRGDVVMISYAALDASLKDGSMTLSEQLMKASVYSPFAAAIAKLHTGASVSLDSSLSLMLAAIYQDVNENLEPARLAATEITTENMKNFLGVSDLAIEEGLAIEPLMSAMAHSVCLIRLVDGEDVDAAKAAISKNVDPRKWICVGVDPENVRVESVGNLILLVMDNENPDGYVKNFKAIPADAKGAVRVGDTIVEKRVYDEKSVTAFAEKLNSLYGTHMSGNKVYYSVIPDKSYYVRDEFTAFLDHEKTTKQIAPLMNKSITEIPLAAALDIESYYKTDLHWRQEKLQNVVTQLGTAMGFTADLSKMTSQSGGSFVGSYGRLLDTLNPEPFTYLTNSATEKSSVSIYGQKEPSTVYDTSKLTGKDPYGVFLSELSPLTVIKNPEATQTRRLILFGDSYATSIAPLLLSGYSEITLVDLRFMASSLIAEHVDFKDADVLFLYSAPIVNNSALLR